MPVARFQMPDGRVARFEVPDGTTPEQAQAMIAQSLASQPDPSAPADPEQVAAAPTREERRAALIASNPGEYDPSSPEWKAKYGPTAGASTFQNVAAGAGKAVADTGRGLGQLLGKGLDAITTPQRSVSDLVTGGAGSTLSQRLGLPQYGDVAEARQRDEALMDTGGGIAGNIGGNVLMALVPGGVVKGAASGLGALRAAPAATNALTRVGQAISAPTTLRGAAALGAATSAVQPVVSESERGVNALLGAGTGAAGQGALNALARVVRPNTRPAVQSLLDEGVTPTPGQILGGAAQRVEEGLTSVPLVGDAIRGGQRRAVEDLNRAAVDRALAPIGQRLPRGVRGREAVEFAEDQLGARYNALTPRLTTQADGQFIQDIQQLRNSMGAGAIDPAMAQRFENILNNQVLVKFQGPNTTLTGQTLKDIESDLGHLWRQFRNSPDPDQRLLGDAIRETQDILRRTVERSNPHLAGELRAINQGWANFKRVQNAAGRVAAEEGVFSPAQLQGAVRAGDRSKDKAAFSRGNALMQDLSDPARSVLGSKVPDSGTPFRSLLALLAGGGLSAVGGIPGVAAAAAAPALYSRAGQNAMATLLARRPDAAVPVSNALRQIAPSAGRVATATANSRQRQTTTD
jgi:hypothetical protein